MAAAALAESRKEVAKRPPTNRAFHAIIGHLGEYQADIVFMQYGDSRTLLKANDGNSCMLLCVEVSTRYSYAIPMAGKSADEVCAAFQEVIDATNADGAPIASLTTDDGKEFNNAAWDTLIRGNRIVHFVKEPGDRFSLGIIDRLCGTLKSWLLARMTEKDSLRWVDELPDVLEEQHTRVSKLVQASPVDLRAEPSLIAHADDLARERSKKALAKDETFAIGDRVRIRVEAWERPADKSSLSKGPSQGMHKGNASWSHKVYTITGRSGYGFSLLDSAGKAANRDYKSHEMLKVAATSVDVPDLFAKVASEARKARRAKKEL